MNMKMNYQFLWVHTNERRQEAIQEYLEARRRQRSSKAWPEIINTDTEVLLKPCFPLRSRVPRIRLFMPT